MGGYAPALAVAGIGWSSCACLGVRASGNIHDIGRCHVTPLCKVGRSESTMLWVITCPLGMGGRAALPRTLLGHQTQVKLWVGETKYVGCPGGPQCLGALGNSPPPLDWIP